MENLGIEKKTDFGNMVYVELVCPRDGTSLVSNLEELPNSKDKYVYICPTCKDVYYSSIKYPYLDFKETK